MTSWLYVDDSGVVQGPFTDPEMADWYAVGWIRSDLLVRSETKTIFKPLHAIRPAPEFTKPPPEQEPEPTLPKPVEQEDEKWFYIDASGEEQGPFALSMMGAWYITGHFTEAVMVRRENERGFTLLGNQAQLFRDAAATMGLSIEEDRPAHEFNEDDQLEDLKPMEGDDDVVLWHYIDDNDDCQGPFPAQQMITWTKLGFLHPLVKVRMDGENTFNCIGDDYAATFNRKPDAIPEAPPDTIPDDTDLSWFYIDDSGAEQGPFPWKHMKTWYDKGLISPAVRVRSNDEEQCSLFANRVPCPGWARHRPPAPIQWDLQPRTDPLDSWYYIDSLGVEQGPFPTARMLSWHNQGLLPADLRVRSATNPQFAELSSFPALAGPDQDSLDIQRAAFISRGKRFRATGPDQSYWDSKGIPDDPIGRQMSHYFDVDAWQEQRNQQLARASDRKSKRRS